MKFNFRGYREGDEEQIVRFLNKTSFGEEYWNIKKWRWLFKEAPGFDGNSIIIAEKDSEVIGCSHCVRRTIILGGSEAVAYTGSTGAVDANYRKRGIFSSIMNMSRKSVRRSPAIFVLGYTGKPFYEKFYRRRNAIGVLQPIPMVKHFNLRERVPKIMKLIYLDQINQEIGNKKNLRLLALKLDYKIQFELKDSTFYIEFQEGKLILKEGKTINPDISVRGDIETILRISNQRSYLHIIFFAIKAIIYKKLRVNGSLNAIIRSSYFFWKVKRSWKK